MGVEGDDGSDMDGSDISDLENSATKAPVVLSQKTMSIASKANIGTRIRLRPHYNPATAKKTGASGPDMVSTSFSTGRNPVLESVVNTRRVTMLLTSLLFPMWIHLKLLRALPSLANT
jgi:hypothetical protein